jgi:thioredoxin reductase (NADPH)
MHSMSGGASEFEVVVAGAGIAGLTAGLTSARLGRRTVILAGGVPGGLLLSIEKVEGVPGFPEGVSGYELCPATQEQAEDAGAALEPAELVGIESQDGGWRIGTTGGDYVAGAVILATGARLKELGVPGEERLRGRGVSHCASCDAPLLRDRTVAVVGGGDSALQEALTLADAAVDVTVLHRGDSLSAQETFQRRATEHPRITVRFGTVVEEIFGDETVAGVRARDVDTSAVSELDLGAVFVYVGLQPNSEPVDGQLSLTGSGHIATDASMRTALPGVLAAGVLRHGSAGRAASAAGEGAAAAIAADRYLSDGLSWEPAFADEAARTAT